MRAAWAFASVAFVVAVGVACKHKECEPGAFECDGANARTCADDGKWTPQRCKSGCSARPHFRCDLVDDPKIGEGCYDDRVATEGFISSPMLSRCSADKKSLLVCNPAGGDRWRFSRDCGVVGCEKHGCRDITALAEDHVDALAAFSKSIATACDDRASVRADRFPAPDAPLARDPSTLQLIVFCDYADGNQRYKALRDHEAPAGVVSKRRPLGGDVDVVTPSPDTENAFQIVMKRTPRPGVTLEVRLDVPL